jgi:D-3-phosphoglycerate dehydrogenase
MPIATVGGFVKIAVLDDYQDSVKTLESFKQLSGHDVTIFNDTIDDTMALAQRLQPFEAIVLIRERTKVTAELLERLPNLKVISQTGKVSNHIDPLICARFGIQVLEGVGSPIAPSELCWALIMAASRYIPSYIKNLENNQWQQNNQLGLGRTLHGLIIGIWGYGKIGRRIASYANAFGMKVMVWGSESSRCAAQQDGFIAANSKREFFLTCDVISLHLRLNNITHESVTLADLRLMKSDSLLVNISRAELIEHGALLAEMKRVPSKKAAIDVYDKEPANSIDEPLISLPNVLCTPHLGYVEQKSFELYFRVAFENLIEFANQQGSHA